MQIHDIPVPVAAIIANNQINELARPLAIGETRQDLKWLVDASRWYHLRSLRNVIIDGGYLNR